MKKSYKIILGIIIALITIIGIIAVIGSSSTEKSSNGLQTCKITGFEFQAPDDLEWSQSVEGSNGFLQNDIYEFDVGIEESMRSYDIYEGQDETINGTKYKIDITGFDGAEDGLNQAQIVVYFEKDGKIFSINAIDNEDKANKEYMLNTTKTIITTMTPV